MELDLFDKKHFMNLVIVLIFVIKNIFLQTIENLCVFNKINNCKTTINPIKTKPT